MRELTGILACVLLAGCFQAEAPRPAVHQALAQAPPMPEAATPRAAGQLIDAYELGESGEASAIPALAASLQVEPVEVRRDAAVVLLDLGGEQAAMALVTALNDPDPRVRLNAVDALGELDGPIAGQGLRQALADGDAEVRRTAGKLLAESRRRPRTP